MLLTKLIPPKSQELKNAVAVFNRFLEEPHSNPQELCEIIIAGGRGCGKSTIGAGMVLKANAETGENCICVRMKERGCELVMEQMLWCIDMIGHGGEYGHSYSNRTTYTKCQGGGIYYQGMEHGISAYKDRICTLPNKKLLWIDEASEIPSFTEYQAIVEATDMGENGIVILTYNPPCSASHWLNIYSEGIYKHNGQNNSWVFKPSFLEMEEEMLGKSFFTYAEALRKNNGRAYANEYFGITTED